MASASDQLASSINLAKFAQATDLKKRLWFTLGALIVFRMLSYVPLPGVDPTQLNLLAQQTQRVLELLLPRQDLRMILLTGAGQFAMLECNASLALSISIALSAISLRSAAIVFLCSAVTCSLVCANTRAVRTAQQHNALHLPLRLHDHAAS